MSTHKVVVDLIAKASGNGFKDAAKDAQNLESKVSSSGAATTGVMAKIGANGKAMGFAVAAGALAGGVALAKFASTSVDAFVSTTDAVRGFQRVAGGTAEDSSKLVFALKRVGVAPEIAARAFGMLSAKIGSGKVDLAQYGVQVKKNADGSVNMSDAVLQLAGALGKMNANARNAAIKDLFGRGGQQILPLLTKTKDELKAIFDLAGKDHQIFSQDDLNQAKDYKAALAEMDLAWQGMEVQIGQAVLPLLQTLTEDVFTPLAQLIADNADAFKTLGIAVSAVVVPALVALTAVKLGGFLSDGYAAIGTFARTLGLIGPAAATSAAELEAVAVAEDGVATSSIAAGAAVKGGLLSSLGGLAPALGTAATALAAFDPSGILLAQVAPNPKSNQAKASDERITEARKFVQEGIAGSRNLGQAYDWLTAQIVKTRYNIRLAKIEVAKRPPQDFWDMLTGNDNGLEKWQNKLWSAQRRLEALKAALKASDATFAASGGGARGASSSVSVLSTAIQEGAQKADTFANAQKNLKDALVAAAGATNADKDAKKQLEDAINRVTAAQDRMNNAIYTTIDASLATKSAQDTLTQALKDGADATTITADANAVAKAKVQELDTAIQAAGQAPLTTAQKNDIYLQALKDLAAQSPQTAAALNPYIWQLQSTIDHTKTVNDNPVNPQVHTGDANAALDGLIGRIEHIKLLDGTTANVYVKTHDDSSHGHHSRNFDGTPDFDGNPLTGGSRAAGGPVSAGKTYLIGERGPELLHMGSMGGSITPNHKLGGTTVININASMLTPTPEAAKTLARLLNQYTGTHGASGLRRN